MPLPGTIFIEGHDKIALLRVPVRSNGERKASNQNRPIGSPPCKPKPMSSQIHIVDPWTLSTQKSLIVDLWKTRPTTIQKSPTADPTKDLWKLKYMFTHNNPTVDNNNNPIADPTSDRRKPKPMSNQKSPIADPTGDRWKPKPMFNQKSPIADPTGDRRKPKPMFNQQSPIADPTGDRRKPKPMSHQKSPHKPNPVDFGMDRFDIREGRYVSIEIISETSHSSFYIRRKGDLDSLAELAKGMDAWYNLKFIKQQELHLREIRHGEYYAARYSFKENEMGVPEGEHWIRVMVYSKPRRHNIRVARIDYGGVFKCHLKDLRHLIGDHRKLPWTAYYSKFEAVSSNCMTATITENFMASVTSARRFGKQLLGLPLRQYRPLSLADIPPFPYIPMFIRAEDPNSNFIQNLYPETKQHQLADKFDKKMEAFWGNRAEHGSKLQRSNSLPSLLWDPVESDDQAETKQKPTGPGKRSSEAWKTEVKKPVEGIEAQGIPQNDHFFAQNCFFLY